VTRAGLIAPEDFWQPFQDFAYSVYRLETLQVYAGSGEGEVLDAFTSGNPWPRSALKDAWTENIAANHRAGKIQQRVHVVAEPLTTYMQFELTWSYGPNADSGEDIRVIPVRAGEWPAEIPHEDYWLFDSRDLYIMRYEIDGTWLGAERVTDPSRIVEACTWRDAALCRAMPWPDYISDQPDLQRHLKR
jgi:hypothetical protein